MLTRAEGFARIVEVNPPELPNSSHLLLGGAWDRVLVTDNVFGKIRVSPYAFAARVTHDVPSVSPTVVVSTRDRNILAIESEVRGALGNGVQSFLVVVGDTMPQVDHLADHYEIVRHLRDLQTDLPEFEVGMPTRLRSWQKKRRIETGAQFLVAGPILDPATVAEHIERLELGPEDPPVYLMVIPPFGARLGRPHGVDGCCPIDTTTQGAPRRCRSGRSPGDGVGGRTCRGRRGQSSRMCRGGAHGPAVRHDHRRGRPRVADAPATVRRF